MRLFSAATLATVAIGTMAVTQARTPATRFPEDDTTIAHVLNRVGFGARPGDVERVRAMGLQNYIDQQLHPERVSDAAAAERLAGLSTLTLSSREIGQQYELPALEARRKKQADNSGDGPGNGLADAAGVARSAVPEPEQVKAASVMRELSEQKVLLAVFSERQLQEVLTDFWFNHFNIDSRKGVDRFLLTEYEREVIRPHVFGSFRDLLGATAKSPAMLFYLDNWMSADPNGPHPAFVRLPARRPRFGPGFSLPRVQQLQGARKNAPKGLNENYGRELMELHTLGVDGGYTQKDVTEVARAFTGWTIEQPRAGGGFTFNPRLHDEGQKVVLGHTIKAGGGVSDGEQVLDILAAHPSTARFISTELVRRFVSDTPPPALVDRAAKRFKETHGNLREVVRTILTSPEFLSPDAVGAKFKTPLEFVASALRTTGATVDEAMPIVRAVQQLGMPLYQCQPPTGYKDTADAWVNTGALVNRMNFALQLVGSKLPGTRVSVEGDTQQLALAIGGPDFQRR